jgi:hypothetical protein
MPMRGDRTKHQRDRNRNSDLDWFAEDPWSDPELASLEDSHDDWEPDLWGTNDEGLDDSLELDDGLEDLEDEEDKETMNEDDYDGWGPVRRRTKRRHED